MNITDYIVNNFRPLTLKSSVNKVEELCNNLQITHIPLVEEGKLIACISKNSAKLLENKSKKLAECVNLFNYFSTDIFISILDLLKIFADNNSTIIPVVHKNTYVGYYKLNDVLSVISSSTFLSSDGLILVVEKDSIKYSMSEVVQIVESNNGVLLGCFISDKTNDKMELTLKILSKEINGIIQALRRYNYLIITEYSDDFHIKNIRERLDYLQTYLNI